MSQQTTSTETTALRLHQVLRAEHEFIPPAPPAEWWKKKPGKAAADGGEPARAPVKLVSAPMDVFQLVDGDTLAARVSGHLRGDDDDTRTFAALDNAPGATPVDEDRHYARLAEWVRERRAAEVAKAAGAAAKAAARAADGAAAKSADAGAAAAAVQAAPAADAEATPAADDEVKPAEISAVLALKLAVDLPVAEPWLRNAELRPYTRGLLKRHLQRRWRVIKPVRGPDELLNRLLLEDVFVKHVVRRDDGTLRHVWTQMREASRSALCLSGGGIRSATFALGLVQGLARHRVLGQFRYLSTVSGGGYLGGWLSAWSRNEGFDTVLRKLDGDEGSTALPGVEAAPVKHLRQYSNYMAPKLGLTSADTWTLAATYLRNLLLIWLVLVPLLAAAVAVPWIVAAFTAYRPSGKTGPAPWITVSVFAVAAGLLAGWAIAYVHANRPQVGAAQDDTNTRARRGQGSFLWGCLLPLAGAVFLWALAWYWFSQLTPAGLGPLAGLHDAFGFDPDGVHDLFTDGTPWLMAGGAVIHLAGWAAALLIRGSKRTLPGTVGEGVVILLTGAAAGLLLLLTSWLLAGLADTTLRDARYAAFAVPGYLAAILLAGFAFEGISSRKSDDARREWNARYSAWLLVVAVAWAGVMGLVLFGPHLVMKYIPALSGVGFGSGALTAALGRSPKSSEGAGKSAARKPGLTTVLAKLTLPLASVVAVLALVIVLSLADMALMRLACSWDGVQLCRSGNVPFSLPGVLKNVPRLVAIGTAGMLALAGLFLGYFIETNRFSLHAMYRNRLIRAYLGASRPAGERRPDPFTGFDDADNVFMGCLGVADPRVADGRRPPFHVLNLALNLVSGHNLAWQERKAESFTVSPLHSGAMNLGYRTNSLPGQGCPTPNEDERYYGGKRGITLGTAMTLSGAAASPNMGYHSSPAITFLMTLFNARLGGWLGNPGPAGDATFHNSSPRSPVKTLVGELLGASNDTNPYVNLSDGGHFENLALYEMVLRRNRFIVVSDAACDPDCSLSDLGNAIRKIRIDQGIPIDFGAEFPLRARSSDPEAPEGRYWAFARIGYACVDAPHATGAARDAIDGVLLYVKPGIYGGEPRDVYNYATANATFPHETTADQFFSESQFESYRALGSHVMEQISKDVDLPALFTKDGQTRFLKDLGKPAGAAARPTQRKVKIDGLMVETP